MTEIIENAKEKKKERAKLIKELRDKSTPVTKQEVLTVTPPTLVKTKRYAVVSDKEVTAKEVSTNKVETTTTTKEPVRKSSPLPPPIEHPVKQEPLPTAPRTQQEATEDENVSVEEPPIELPPKVVTEGEKLLRVNNAILEFENANTKLCTIRPNLSFGEQQKVQNAIRENLKQLQVLRREKGRIERAIKVNKRR
jgi:hypothetical protein